MELDGESDHPSYSHPRGPCHWSVASSDRRLRFIDFHGSELGFLGHSHRSHSNEGNVSASNALLSSSRDRAIFAFVVQVFDRSSAGLTTAQFHPDGLIFGAGTTATDDKRSQVNIWDLKDQSNLANFEGKFNSWYKDVF